MSRVARVRRGAFAFLVGLGLLWAAMGHAQTEPRVTPGELLIRGHASATNTPLLDAGSIQVVVRGLGARVRSVERLGMAAESPWLVRYDGGEDPEMLAARLAADPRVAYAGPNHWIALGPEISATAPATSPPAPRPVPDDSLATEQWALYDAWLPDAWSLGPQGKDVLIAIIDTGVDLTHPDLRNQIAVNAAEADGLPGVDDDQNGYVDDIYGYDFTDAPELPGSGDWLERDNDPSDDHGHGTQVAGVAAAQAENGIGIAGAAPQARILAVRAGLRTTLPFLSGLLQEDDATAAIFYAVDRGAQILNLSWGDNVDSPAIRDAVAYARKRGCLVVVAAGNTGVRDPFFPANAPGALVVGSSSQGGGRSSFSTYGPDLDLLAGGASLVTTGLDGTYVSVSGTSFSAPLTAGAAAVVWSAHPSWSAAEIAWALRLSATRDGGWTESQGWGRLHALNALHIARPPTVELQDIQWSTPDASLEGTVAHADLVRWSLSVAPDSLGASEIALVQDASSQEVASQLASWSPPTTWSGFVQFTLRAWVNGFGAVEERSRWMLPTTNLDRLDWRVEPQAQKSTFDLVATWSSSAAYQGIVEWVSDAERVVAQEATLGTHHAVRLKTSENRGTLSTYARPHASAALQFLGAEEVHFLPGESPTIVRLDHVPPGTPMEGIIDLDNDGNPETVVESPVTNGIYGNVQHYELVDAESPPVLVTDSSISGIPRFLGDGDGDGLPELVVYQISGWQVYESREAEEFPSRVMQAGDTESLPVRFVETPDSRGMLALFRNTLRLYVPTVPNGYAVGSSASGGAGDLVAPGTRTDLDQDGVWEEIFADTDGNLQVFRVSASGLEHVQTLVPPLPVLGTMLGWADGTLLTAEIDPQQPEFEGDIDRAGVRVRFWQVTSSGMELLDTLAFAGLVGASQVQLVRGGYKHYLRRGTRVDGISLYETAGPEVIRRMGWRGGEDSGLGAAEGVQVIDIEGRAPHLWIGASARGIAGGANWMEYRGTIRTGGSLRVSHVEPGDFGKVRVLLDWSDDWCVRSEDRVVQAQWDTGEQSLVGQGTAWHEADPGQRTVYTLSGDACSTVQLTVTASLPALPTLTWDDDLLVLRSERSMVEPPDALWLLTAGSEHRPSATYALREGHELRITSDHLQPDSLIVVGITTDDGLPLGGTHRLALTVPPRPGADEPFIIHEVRYESSPPRLQVSLSRGVPETCAAPFVLNPEGRTLAGSPVSGDATQWEILLDAPLSTGDHSLAWNGPCGISGLGASRSFRVGTVLYPNPVGPSSPLFLEHAPSGTQATLLDPSGNAVRTWTVDQDPQRLDLSNLAPGFYLVRLVFSDGGTEIHRIAIIR